MDRPVQATDPSSTERPSLRELATDPLITRDYEARPALVYESLRARHGAVAPVDLLGVPVWLALGYAEVLEVMQNRDRVWSKRLDAWRDYAEGRVPRDWPLLPALEVDHVVFQEGRRLEELRGAYHAALRPFQDPASPQARELRAATARYADELIDVMTEGSGGSGFADLSAQYARPLPLMVVDRLLGFANGAGDEVLMDMWRVLDAGPDSGPALERLLAALAELAAAKMARPGDDFPSHMLAARPEFTVDELSRELMMLVGVAGDFPGVLINNTVVEVINGGAGVRDSLSAGLIRETVNRVAMASPPMANLTMRCPSTDVRLGGRLIRAGEPVMLSVAAAHADPAFTGGAGLDRADRVYQTRAHLAWGAGPHHCLGVELATMIVETAIDRLFARFGALSLTLPPDQLPWRSSPLMRGLRSLPVRYELAPRPAQPVPSPAPQPVFEPEPDAPRPEQPRSALWRFLRGLRRGAR
ncbi:cytochrome P450 [Thermomonospora cellulosilytica]|uniref:Cytochrome P450 n=1 Tax=Thermomonospora cellulosilytica TaxID=1411118 RepID=A0A7W3MY43_9ACTN|nr:cytochrome P450 [Thermomonospora cellulosilytica]MBA9004001.1 cytochrome P450 [Thermomonospora cellulosilytica]